MMGWPEVFGEQITIFSTFGLQVDNGVTLFDTVYYPVEHHIYCLVMLLLDSINRNSDSILVVCLYVSVRVGMTKIIQGDANGDCLFCMEEECSKFCFQCRCKNMLDDGGVYMDITIGRWNGR